MTPAHELLLTKITNPFGNWLGWITPGGGVDPGEDELTALKRELYEETGFTLNSDAIKVWRRFVKFPWDGKNVEQAESYFLIHTAKFNPVPIKLTETEKRELLETRWWKISDIKSSSERFAPKALAERLELLLTGNIPIVPVEIE